MVYSVNLTPLEQGLIVITTSPLNHDWKSLINTSSNIADIGIASLKQDA